MVRLTRLKIDRFRNVKPGTDLHFGPTFNVLLGKNATGKTTLLDLIAAVTNDDLSAYAKEEAGFDLTWWLERGEDQVCRRAERAHGNSKVLPAQSRGDSAFGDDWQMVFESKGADVGRLGIFEGVGPLADIPKILGFASGEMRPRLLRRSQRAGVVEDKYHGFDFLFRRADGSQVPYGRLSFGQKRLSAFLWYLAIRRDLPVVADELFNGLHHEWIELCFDHLYERQSFLVTQHPYLLDHVPIESAAGVEKTFIRCTLEVGPDGAEQMVWRNFTEDQAELFHVAHQTGIAHVSEILRSEGLW